MDDKTQKERLEQELRFLKESFDAEVISKEEFEKGKDRIEKKLKEIEKAAKQQITEEQKIEEPKKEQVEEPTKAEEPKTDEAIEAKEGETIKLKVFQEEHEHLEPVQVKVKPEEKRQEPAPETPKIEIKEEKKKSKFLNYSVVLVVIVLVVFFSYSLLKNKKAAQESAAPLTFVAACSSNQDCRQEEKEGICLKPGAKEAKCEFKDIPKVNVIVLNDRKNCFNCDTQRILSIIESWFGVANIKEIDYGTEDGKSLAEKVDARLLPTYIFEENITKKPKFDEFKQLFIKKNNYYILSDDAAGSTFYFKQSSTPNKLDLFVVKGDDASMRAENNVKEFLEVFKDVKFDKYSLNDKLAQELKIRAFPTFLVNNRVKFSGVHSAETIKENFCKLNKLPACEKSMSKNLV